MLRSMSKHCRGAWTPTYGTLEVECLAQATQGGEKSKGGAARARWKRQGPTSLCAEKSRLLPCLHTIYMANVTAVINNK